MTTRSIHSLSFTRNLTAGTALIAAALLLTACGKKEKSMETASNKPAAPAPTAAPTTSTTPATLPAGFESLEQRVSYGVGFKMASGIAQQKDFKVDRAALIAGIDDALAGGKLRLEEKDIQAAFMEMQQRAEAAAAEAGKANIALGEAYLAKNKAKPGVKTTASGLQYEVIKAGTGAKPKAENTVRVHYHGTLIDGKVFDSSVERNEPIEFAVQGVIPGWTEALQLMSVGDKWKLTIPSALAYGPRGAGADIPPNSVLVFEVELLEVK
ncbi:FKBP-type peptidyl-prolyl cis-trans isomerase [Oleiharenicola lentus]|uniref:FKBP-type peptidyl-prolyl cis-trans isomerase n=1 Tax=Oleiharenicola lentus TaxID=2508720 RepID=UPI003F66C31F